MLNSSFSQYQNNIKTPLQKQYIFNYTKRMRKRVLLKTNRIDWRRISAFIIETRAYYNNTLLFPRFSYPHSKFESLNLYIDY